MNRKPKTIRINRVEKIEEEETGKEQNAIEKEKSSKHNLIAAKILQSKNRNIEKSVEEVDEIPEETKPMGGKQKNSKTVR